MDEVPESTESTQINHHVFKALHGPVFSSLENHKSLGMIRIKEDEVFKYVFFS